MVEQNKICFVIMPISTPDGYQEGHFDCVYERIFKPAIEQAGFVPCRVDEGHASKSITDQIYRNLIQSQMVLCDISANNPNVFYELGVRHGLEEKISLVKDDLSEAPFDIKGIHFDVYSSNMDKHYSHEDDIETIRKNLIETYNDETTEIRPIRRTKAALAYEGIQIPRKANSFEIEMKLSILLEDINTIKLVVSQDAFNELKPYFKRRLNEISETLAKSNGIVEVNQKYLRLQISICDTLLR